MISSFVFLVVLIILSCSASSAVLAQQGAVPPKVIRIIPDVSEKVPTDLKEIRVVFNEKMTGVDVAHCGVQRVGIRWEDDNTTHVISFSEPLSPSKVYRFILGRNEGYQSIAGVPLAEEYVLTFTTEGPEPVTPTFVDTTPVRVADIEGLDLSDKLLCRVSENPTEGFNFPYYLLIPQGISLEKPIYLLVEPNNTGVGSSFKSLDRNAKESIETCSASSVARKLKIPLLMPVFPRPGGTLYTHALDRETLLIRDGDLKRIDLQLIAMIAHAQTLLRHNDVKVNEKIFMNGFSASGTFTNRFAILHPTLVRAVATGGVNCIPTFPTDQWNGTTMRYPVGIADIKEIAGIDFDEAAYKRVSQYIYMGALDNNDTIPYRDAYDAVDAELVKNLIGAEMMPNRWDTSQSIYRTLEIPAQFVTYENTRHEIKDEMIDDVIGFFEANSGTEIVEINPYQYSDERTNVPSTGAATESEEHADLTQQGTTSPKVVRTIPDVSEKVPMDLKEIRIVFNQKMTGVDVAHGGVPVGNVRWEDNNTIHVISFNQRLSSSKIYRLILGRNEGYRNMIGVPMEEEYVLTFTTEGPDPVTPTFVDMTPIHVTGIEELNLSNELLCRVSVDLTEGFAFPYYLFVPQGMDSSKPVHLLIEPCNTGTVSDNFKVHDKNAKGLAERSHATLIARKLKVPLLVPVFPRPGGDRMHIYTHALDRETLLIKEGELRRIDLQLIKMIAHAQRLLRHNDLKVNEQVFMNGFSASGLFTNRFAILHPTVVRAVATGGVNSIPTFPTDRWNDTIMRYPIGIADVKEIAGVDFDETSYKKVSQYIYMGVLDDNDAIPWYQDAYDEIGARSVKSLIEVKMVPDRWHLSQSIYKTLEIPSQFVTYEDTGHEIKSEMIDDIVAFFEANAGHEIVEIVPHQYPIGE